MEFAEDQPLRLHRLVANGLTVPLNLPGRFAAGDDCKLSAEGVLARCTIGKGSATILADAALLDLHEPDTAAPAALEGLVALAFGETAGR
jgi:hypothetical protein